MPSPRPTPVSTPRCATRSAPTCRSARASSPAPSPAPRSSSAETFQVFVGNPRGWALSPASRPTTRPSASGSPSADMRVFVHAPYLVNLGCPTPATYEKSLGGPSRTPCGARRDRRRGRGRAHRILRRPGARREARYAAAMAQVREGLLPVLDELGDDRTRPGCCWSRPPGRAARCAPASRTSPPTSPRWSSTRRPASAWTPATSSPLARRWTSRRDHRHRGPDRRDRRAGRLRLIHANDSMDVRGAFKDRHQTDRPGPHRRGRVRASSSPTRPPPGSRSCSRRPAPATPGNPTSRCSKKLREEAHTH